MSIFYEEALKYDYELSTKNQKDISEITIDENSFKNRIDLLFSESKSPVWISFYGFSWG